LDLGTNLNTAPAAEVSPFFPSDEGEFIEEQEMDARFEELLRS
jgi:hypothetical protein